MFSKWFFYLLHWLILRIIIRFVMKIYRISTTGCVIVQRAMQNVTEDFDIV